MSILSIFVDLNRQNSCLFVKTVKQNETLSALIFYAHVLTSYSTLVFTGYVKSLAKNLAFMTVIAKLK